MVQNTFIKADITIRKHIADYLIALKDNNQIEEVKETGPSTFMIQGEQENLVKILSFLGAIQ